MVFPGIPYYGIYLRHIGYQYTLLRDFHTKCRKVTIRNTLVLKLKFVDQV